MQFLAEFNSQDKQGERRGQICICHTAQLAPEA